MDPNYTLSEALESYNQDQVMTQTMWYIVPTGTGWVDEDDIRKMQIYGQGFEVPARTNDFAEVQYRGYPIPTPTVPKMTQEHSMTINADSQQKIRKAFLDQMNVALDGNIDITYPSFAADRRPTAGAGGTKLSLYLLNPDYSTWRTAYHFHGVRVSEVGTMTLSNTDGGIASFTVQFKSVYWSVTHGGHEAGLGNMETVNNPPLASPMPT